MAHHYLSPHPVGGYDFLPSIEPYSSGIVASPGFEVVRATLGAPLPWREGLLRLEEFLTGQDRPPQALCGVELRGPEPFTREGFFQFNREYYALLEERGHLLEGVNPIARTNVCPVWDPPSETVLHAFSFTRPSSPRAAKGHTFVVAGAGEMGKGSLMEAPIIRQDETSMDAMREKAEHVMYVLGVRMLRLGVRLEQVTATHAYSLQPLTGVLESAVFPKMAASLVHGLTLHPCAPPIIGLEFEMDVRGVAEERVVAL